MILADPGGSASLNTDREIWRALPGDYYSPSIHVTEGGGIGINYGVHVIVAPIKSWHDAGEMFICVNPNLPTWKWRLAMWLLTSPQRKIKLT